MFKSIGIGSRIAGKASEIQEATKIILPGIGHFDYGMKNLEKRDLIGALNDKVLGEKTPVLGICLGAQLLTRGSEEGSLPGLAWIAADTSRFDRSKMPASLRIPHMGWADTEYRKSSHLFAGIAETPRYYYVHSYHIVCDNEGDELCHAIHGYRFVAGVENGNIRGVQFHPEKSHRFGMQLLRNFANWTVPN